MMGKFWFNIYHLGIIIYNDNEMEKNVQSFCITIYIWINIHKHQNELALLPKFNNKRIIYLRKILLWIWMCEMYVSMCVQNVSLACDCIRFFFEIILVVVAKEWESSSVLQSSSCVCPNLSSSTLRLLLPPPRLIL